MGSLWDGGSQLDFGVTESQLANTQVDFSFLDFTQPADDDWAAQAASQARWGGSGGMQQVCSAREGCCARRIARCPCSRRRRRRRRRRRSPALWGHPPALQVPTFQPTQGDAALGLDAALSQLAFQEAVEGEVAGEEQPAELPEWACA